MTRNEFRLKPSARLQRYLGQELIADPNLAVIEFVKNAYDAGASDVIVSFRPEGPDSSLIVADNGVGMSRDSFETDWMHPGFSRKSNEAPESVRLHPPDTNAGTRQSARPSLGEKGLGRFAAGRLGAVLQVFTRPSTNDPWLHVTFEWERFDDMTKSMDEILIPFNTQAPPERIAVSTGTVILIQRLRLKWNGRVPGRPAPGRSRTRLGRLKQDLQLLLRPLNKERVDFKVSLQSDSVVEADDIGMVTPISASRSAAYQYSFKLHSNEDNQTVVNRHLTRSSQIANEFDVPMSTEIEELIIGPEEARRTERPVELLCGDFSGVFHYDPPPQAKRASQLDAVGHGVLIYRDGALVEPYGLDSNDWLGVEARKAQRQGHALVQPNTFSGEIRIGRIANPRLLDMANRQGLIDNDAASQFIAHVQAEFRFFEGKITPELEKRWKTKPQRAAESAEQRVKLARVQMKSVGHSLRQPLMGLTTEIEILKEVLSKEPLTDSLRYQIGRVITSTERYVSRAEVLLSRLVDVKIPEFAETTARELVDAAIAQVSDESEHAGVRLSVNLSTERSLVLPVELIEDALAELLRNAIESPRSGGSGSVNAIATDQGRRDVRIEIQDDGAGLDGVGLQTPLTEISLETKGRPSGGLSAVADSVILARGRVELVANGPDGATFAVLLPGGLHELEDAT